MDKIVIKYQIHHVLRNKKSNWNKPPTSENENATQLNNTQPKNTEQTPTQEQKINLENFKRIMNGEMTTLPSLRNIEWRTIKAEKEKINQLLNHISTNNITELNKLINAGVKLVSEKIGISSKSMKKKIKTRMGNSTGNADKKHLRKQAKMIKLKKDAGTCRDKKEKATQEKMTIQLEEIIQKVLAKEGILKDIDKE